MKAPPRKVTIISIFSLGLLASWITSGTLHGLDWEKTEVVASAESGASSPVAEFSFTNTSKSTVTVTDVKESCDCTTALLEKKTYAPGERGHIVVEIDPKGLSGAVVRTVTVTTNEKDHDLYVLTVKAALPEALTLTPDALHWAVASPASPQSIEVKVNLPDGVEITRALSNRDDFKVELATLEARRRYRVTITPASTASPQMAVVLLQTSPTLPAGTTHFIYAQVR
ncbi:MAG TPA: DUF1573 domain-containing protein [Candidatus Acidoferrales bacterium]|jgi:hypothetical protein|nr:DUF1573 domain-containing protein [Candidatus Acidoferrales bacterium]